MHACARVVELVDTRDLKSLGLTAIPVQVRVRVPYLLFFDVNSLETTLLLPNTAFTTLVKFFFYALVHLAIDEFWFNAGKAQFNNQTYPMPLPTLE